jgi:hypothetical protein
VKVEVVPTRSDALSPVERGALLLDEHAPGWWQRIDLDTLDLSRSDQCVCSQAFGGGFEGWLEGERLFGTARDWVYDYGFHGFRQDEWVALIRAHWGEA